MPRCSRSRGLLTVPVAPCTRAQCACWRAQVIALAERGALFDPGPCMYMEKLAVGPQVGERDGLACGAARPCASCGAPACARDHARALCAAVALPVHACVHAPGVCYHWTVACTRMHAAGCLPACMVHHAQVDPESVSLDYSVRHNLKWVARALDKPVSDVTVLILDRPR